MVRSSAPNPSLPKRGRLVGIDFGTVRIGLALCDPSQSWATPLETYTRRRPELDARFFSDLAEQENIVGWVVGLPIHCDGKESQKSSEARAFGQWLTELSRRPVVFFDERFTTAEARRLLGETNLSPQKRKNRLDQLAAQLILSHYLECSENLASQNEALDGGPAPPLDETG